ncbi:MAG: short-chain fatty acyl-CoA regulator family protein, partial [Rhizobiaceae bacterium]|nr:short-chain fatty acyl-CoA regulator family protein [Rhizobiaceae bacterium]
ISPSYLNLIERNQRPLTVQLLIKLASIYEFDLEELQRKGEANTIGQLREIFADPLLSSDLPDNSELIEISDAAPNASAAMIKLYRAYRESLDRLSGLSRMMAKEGGEAVSSTARLPIDEMRETFERISPYFPAIERAAAKLAKALAPSGNLMASLQQWLHTHHNIAVQILPVETMPLWRRRFDRHSNRLFISERLSPADQVQEVAMEVAFLAERELIGEEVEFLKLSTDEARRLARFEFARLLALAMMMPYDNFLSSARRVNYDINILRSRFSVTFAQASWRLIMLAKHGQSAVPFFVMEIDAAGNRIRRGGTSGFPLTRFGGDCPKLIVHQAFTSPGQIFAEQVISPDDARFIVLGRTIEGLRSGYEDRPQRTALLIGFDIAHAGEVVYGAGLIGPDAKKATDIGPACRLCERQGCIARADPPITRPLGLDEMVTGLSVFDFQ